MGRSSVHSYFVANKLLTASCHQVPSFAIPNCWGGGLRLFEFTLRGKSRLWFCCFHLTNYHVSGYASMFLDRPSVVLDAPGLEIHNGGELRLRQTWPGPAPALFVRCPSPPDRLPWASIDRWNSFGASLTSLALGHAVNWTCSVPRLHFPSNSTCPPVGWSSG